LSLMDSWTDSELVVAVRAGNKAAFGILIERNEAMVRRLALRMIGDADIAYDLAQDALLQAFLSLDSLRLDNSFKSWLYGVTLNVCRMYLRSQRSNIYSLDVLVGGIYREPLDHGPTPEEIAERLELRRAVTNAVETLSSANRAAVLLYYYEDFSLRDAAAVLGISVAALKGRLHKARRQLETYLLSIYPSMATERGAINMIPVKIADVTTNVSVRDSGEHVTFNQVILFDEAGRRAIVIWIGNAEANAIAFGLGGYDFGRPMTPLFTSRLLQAAGATLEWVQISALKDDVYYATVRVRMGNKTQDVDARPSDAVAVAAYLSTPIYVSEDVLERAGRPIPAGAMPTGKGIKDIIAFVEADKQKHTVWVESKPAEQRHCEYDAQMDAILLEAFGSGT
jgi:RNA polymerase sigma factor (sigma-70 family)